MGKPRMDLAVPAMPDIKPEASIRVATDSKLLKGITSKVKLGRTVTIEVTGKVTAFRMDQYDQSLTLQITDLECYPGMAAQQDEAKERKKVY